MMKITVIRLLLLVSVLMTLTPAFAEDYTMTCSSSNYKYRACPVHHPGEFQVLVATQKSRAACVEGTSWGKTADSVWVNNGCSALFRVVDNTTVYNQAPQYGQPTQSNNASYGGNSQLTCNSRNYKYNECTPSVTGQYEIYFSRQTSRNACTEGTTWGRTTTGVWVNKGCSAVFNVNARPQYGSSNTNSLSSGSSFSPTLSCNSSNYKYSECSANAPGPFDVSLEKQTSRHACVEGSTWGRTSTGVWVNNGCSARFRVVDRSRRW